MHTITGTLRPTPLPWLSVLSNIAPLHLRREEATASMVEKIRANRSLALYQDIFQPPRAQLTSRHPEWSSLPNQKPSVTDAWQEEWTNSDARNQFLIVKCHRPCSWFRPPTPAMASAEQVLYRPGPVCSQPPSMRSSLCECGLRQLMTHIVEDCHLTRLQDGLRTLHSADEAAVVWLDKTSKR